MNMKRSLCIQRRAFCETFQFLRSLSTFRAQDIHVTRTTTPQTKTPENELQFGVQMSDHMLEVDYTAREGWGRPHIKPLSPLHIHPAAKVLHYAIEAFEGMKCFRGVDGKIRMFRPMDSLDRLCKSTARSALPAFDANELLKCLKRFLWEDQEWVPWSEKCSIYIRPVIIGTNPNMGVSASTEAKLFVIASPVGPYFPSGMKGVRVLADPRFVRAWPGGCGGFKMGSNYAPTISIQAYATNEHNCQQVVWLFGEEQQMTEMGVMNLFIYWINEQGEKELLTPPLESGLILPGITRRSVLDLTREWNEFKVVEREITMKTFLRAFNENRVLEMFGSGTACTVCPVATLLYDGQELTLSENAEPGELVQKLYQEIQDIFLYRKPHRWMESIESDSPEEMSKHHVV